MQATKEITKYDLVAAIRSLVLERENGGTALLSFERLAMEGICDSDMWPDVSGKVDWASATAVQKKDLMP